MLFTSALAFGAMFLTLIKAESIVFCGTQPYYPSQYTCYDGFLCPIIQGEATLKCANACYLKEAYACNGGQLALHSQEAHAFQLVALNSISAINGKLINACGRSFWVGGGSCTYCPSQAGPICAKVANSTILFNGGSLDVIVPGGQYSYVESNGALGFTQAHSAYVPPNALLGGLTGFEDGYFVYAPAPNWLACPSTSGAYQIFARLPGIAYAATCVGLNIATRDIPAGTVGAWQYT